MLRSERDVALTPQDFAQTVEAIAAVQLPDGSIPWFAGGPLDPWDHVEAAMALTIGGRPERARDALLWLAREQRPDGSWPAKLRSGRVIDPTRDANFCAYIAVGLWHHWLATGDDSLLWEIWPCVDRSTAFTLDLQREDGAVRWARDEMGVAWPGALLTSCSCIHLSIRCAIAIAEHVGHERPDWELSLLSLREVLINSPERFEPKDRFSMDWYYPVLGGALEGSRARQRLEQGWDTFVVDGLGVKCVRDRPWVTVAETSELVLALDAAGMCDAALEVFSWIQYLRSDTGAYWTGATFPDGLRWPREKPTWTSAAVVLAAAALENRTPASGLFRGEGLPAMSVSSDSIPDAL